MFIVSEQIYDLYEKIASGELKEENMQYHNEIAKALKEDYDLVFECFCTCSVEFFEWFAKDYLFEIVELIRFHGKKELLLALKHQLIEQVDGDQFDPRISSLATIYHATYKSLR